MTTAFIFPGQGSQAVGMGKALAERYPEARAVFDEVDAALGEPLSRIMFEGPEAELTATANTQPALMAMSLAAFRVLEARAGLNLARDAAFVAGHSLGEYSALAAAGTLTIADAARLLRLRGQSMQDAVPAGMGAMAALIGTDAETALEIAEAARQGQVCDLANDNGGGQLVLSGNAEAVGRAVEIAKTKGVKRAVLLKVSAPFHCALMEPAAVVMREALQAVPLKDPVVPLVANRNARPMSDVGAIRDALVEQVCATVRWRECVMAMTDAGVTEFVEVGAGSVLGGLVKRIAPGAATLAFGASADLEPYVAMRGHADRPA